MEILHLILVSWSLKTHETSPVQERGDRRVGIFTVAYDVVCAKTIRPYPADALHRQGSDGCNSIHLLEYRATWVTSRAT